MLESFSAILKNQSISIVLNRPLCGLQTRFDVKRVGLFVDLDLFIIIISQ